MNVIVVGGGKVGRKLVEDFNYEGDDVVLIDIKSEICDRIQDDYDVRCVCGSGTDLETLREAEANKADIFIAVTENDEFNALCTVMAKKLSADRCVARVKTENILNSLILCCNALGINLIMQIPNMQLLAKYREYFVSLPQLKQKLSQKAKLNLLNLHQFG